MDGHTLPSKKLRDLLYKRTFVEPKIVLLEDDIKRTYYYNLSKVVNIQNKSRMLRLLHRDVYCGEKLYRFGMSDSDQCRRCFGTETILHLLMDCPYSKTVYSILNVNAEDIEGVLGIGLARGELEIRCDLINNLVFRQQILAPAVLVRCTLEKYAKGMVEKGKSKKFAQAKLQLIFNAG